MSNYSEELKKELAEALRTFDIDISNDLTEKRENLEEDQRDYEEMSILTRKKIDDLTEKGEQVVRDSGMSREALEAFGNNPNNFTSEQWEALQKIKEVTAEYKKMNLEGMSSQFQESIEGTVEKDKKKQKGRFAKKKDWIPL